jgi:hypothetical protein
VEALAGKADTAFVKEAVSLLKTGTVSTYERLRLTSLMAETLRKASPTLISFAAASLGVDPSVITLSSYDAYQGFFATVNTILSGFRTDSEAAAADFEKRLAKERAAKNLGGAASDMLIRTSNNTMTRNGEKLGVIVWRRQVESGACDWCKQQGESYTGGPFPRHRFCRCRKVKA